MPPSGRARSTTTTTSSATASSNTSGRWSSPACRKSRCRSRFAKSTKTCSSTPRANRLRGRQVTERKRIIVGVAGGIAAYKAATVVRQLTEAGHSVRVVPTESALRFIGAATFEALSGNPVHTGVWDDVHEVPHVRIGQEADLVVVAPATADLLARAVSGRADDLLTATLLTARCPVMFAPAMHTEMWFHPATVDNVATLRRRGAIVLEPASGRLTGADSG